MGSNISFKSNIYPAKRNDDNEKYERFILYSDNYLTKIESIEKMNQIREKHNKRSFPRYWTVNQEKLFTSMKHNPCMGIVVKDNEYIIIEDVEIPKSNFIKYDPLEYNYDYTDKNYKLFELETKVFNNDVYDYKETVKFNDDKQNILSETDIPKIDTEVFLSAISEHAVDTVVDTVTEESEEQDYIEPNKNNIDPIREGNIFSKFINKEQKDIIEADPDNVIFVDAGPGTGKTYTLIQRLQYLVERRDVPADEIQVLCFTNSAVNEIKERLNRIIKDGGDRSLANVDVRTFHSFAWWLIGQANAHKWHNIIMHDLNYDQSIKTASNIMSNDTYYPQVVGNWSHFIVDEIQDLTNHLARFVLYLVNACMGNKTGITVLGDSCQAIYDYTLKDERNFPMSSQDFYDALVRKTKDIGKYISLLKNHRQIGTLSDFSTDYRNAILSQNIDEMQNEVKNISEKLNKLEGDYLSIDKKIINKIGNGDNSSKICFVCRNNGQTLTLSSVFRKKGIEHTLNVDLTDKNFALWISELFYDYEKQYITHDEFIGRYDSLVTNKSPKHPEEIWERIIVQTKSKDSVYISDLLRSIALSKIDDVCFRYANESNILVSNIHKTKGREYDHVVVDQSFIADLLKKKKDIGEYKTLYVALTRPKKSIHSTTLSKYGYFDKNTIYGSIRKRVHRMKCIGIDSKGKEKWAVDKFELLSNIDIDIESYVYNTKENIQIYFKKINIGDPILLRRSKENNKTVYNIVHKFEDKDTYIGKLYDTFKDDLLTRMKLSEADYLKLPDTITDLYVSGKYTYIATKDYMKSHPEIKEHSQHGVWQWIEFTGIGHASYDVY